MKKRKTLNSITAYLIAYTIIIYDNKSIKTRMITVLQLVSTDPCHESYLFSMVMSKK